MATCECCGASAVDGSRLCESCDVFIGSWVAELIEQHDELLEVLTYIIVNDGLDDHWVTYPEEAEILRRAKAAIDLAKGESDDNI